MPNILLTRIDNRLIHGQVAVTWSNHLGANLILVANDEIVNNEVQQSLMDMAVSDAMETRYFTLQETIDNIQYASDEQLIFLVVKTPQDVLKLVKGGVPIKKVNIGNMHYTEGKTQITSTVSINDSDKQAFKELHNLGIQMEIRRVPDEKSKDIMEFIK
ncbi:PTS sugar transporter subunit IIB [Clostridium botulinum]|uniref:PTS system N-acetylgalactosamine-specific transporter subunit IIB n=1 Tax=Clostridium botulinum C/D str. DC5 TaxID=1443128 RepID=A0A0A0IJI8_CLOBO|nr:PTS N-acetylgalactosamine transporter subunit IIB [Clostridium botulinum]KEI04893.1 PTS system N-acetylgalactosamine-specific transporter subunit IIB [Clostridium botulinum C/D str. BKT75002]KEI08708.1 PTS system N-acetylgalactosamine-specific transporter subunit IIB [Clostridium botulinum C/D str. BKT2873]KGM95705.1 PTS system N-acetylgalactosamine-specific transporter subunit IIB [Clostridium botulinum D str. CCUG 7971]KGN00452.1 PTS system N-acetylgalactosamine-specific transporter subuni